MPEENVEKRKSVSPGKRALFWSAIAFVIGFSAYHSQPGAQMVREVLLLTKVVVGTTFAVITFVSVFLWRLLLRRIEPRSQRAYVFLSFGGPAIVGLLFFLLVAIAVYVT